MSRKPHDILDFLRRQTGSQEDSPEPVRFAVPSDGGRPQKTTRMLVLRRSQAIVSAVAAGLLVALALLLGMSLGGRAGEPSDSAQTGVWVVRVITYDDSDAGRVDADVLARQLEAQGLGQVTLHRLKGDKLVLALGAWLKNPTQDAGAKELLARVQKTADAAGKRHFESAGFWRIER
ncbi:MAG: hypothetical protein ACREID_02430 [Planctomycetota bacterium]